jgi:Metallo-beta-lactamase superfamily
MRLRPWAAFAIVTAGTFLSAQALPPTAALKLVITAADAMGGKDRVLQIKTLKIYGYGQQAYQNGGGNITASPDAPQKWVNINGSERSIDLEHGRMRLQQRLVQDFVFAYERNMTGRGPAAIQMLDGDIAFNVGPDGRAARASDAVARQRRIEMLNHPVTILRAALDPSTKVGNLRTMGRLQAVDLTTARGDSLTLAVDPETHLPSWVSWVAPDGNLGDVRFRTSFVGYQAEGGVQVPSGFNTVMDFRNVVYQKLYVDKTSIDGPIDSMTASQDVRSAILAPPRAPNVEVIPVARGIWYLKAGGNSTLFEFADHLTLFEAYGSEANTKAIVAKARTVVPGKPLTEVIVSHHHFDHSGGLRAAVSEGLTIITHRGNVDLFKEMAGRPATLFPDALGRNPRPIRIRPVDDSLVLKDSAMEVRIYRTIANSHMANGLFAYAPEARVVAEGDLVDEGWDISFWGNSYPDSVNYWKLQVDRDLPVHGNIHTYQEVLALIRKQVANAQALCKRVDEAGFSMQGCPVTNAGF